MLSNLTLNIKNFQSYLDSGDINLDGKIILSGLDDSGESNGCGKSTVLKALDLFLTDEYKDYTKADIKLLTNVNAKRGGYIDITIKCMIDNVPFEANINGKDYFKMTADEYMLNKFRQELTGSIMNQGLVDNIADFEKRSELDNYIDKFYNTKEIVTKLKDLETTTVAKINVSLDKAKADYTNKVNKVNLLTSKISSLKDNINYYAQFEGTDVKALENEILLAKKECEGLLIDYSFEKTKCTTVISGLNSKDRDLQYKMEMSEKEQTRIKNKLKDSSRQIELANQREDYIRTQTTVIRNNYLNEVTKHINKAVVDYNNKKLDEKPNSVVSIEDLDKINKLYNKEFEYGCTYREVASSVRETYEKVGMLCGNVKCIKVELIPVSQKPTEPYYITYDEDLKLKGSIPEDLNLNFKDIKKGVIDTSFYDNQLKGFDSSALNKELEDERNKYDALSKERETLSKQINSENNKYNELLQKELKFTSITNRIKELESQIENSVRLTKYKEELASCESELAVANTDAMLADSEVKRFEFNISELHKIIDNVSRFSGEELRTEFGTKLARISTILLEDIFGKKGTITLDSNGTKTSFKFNEGAGDLNFKSLSGGQLQKIKICINLAMLLFFYKDRQYLFLDEVFQNLDNPSKQRLIQYIVKELKIKNVLLIQHDTLKFEGFRDVIVYRGKDLNSVVKECK